MLTDSTLQEYLGLVAAGTPTPGGGSVAAYAGAAGAALLIMYANLTLGREKYVSAWEIMERAKTAAEICQDRLMKLVDEDAQAFAQVMQAYRLPKNTAEEKEARLLAVEQALAKATLVPLQVAEQCAALLRLMAETATLGNPNAASDLGVGIHMASAGLSGALMNVRINLTSFKDFSLVKEYSARCAALEKEGQANKLAALNSLQGAFA